LAHQALEMPTFPASSGIFDDTPIKQERPMRWPPLAPSSLKAKSSAILMAFVFAPTTLPAQSETQDEPYDEDTVLEEVIVTGTRIVRRDFNSPSPLTTISREAIEFSGQPTLEEYLNQMPQLQPVTGRALNNGSDGTTHLDLRSMGAGRTLTMLNGRRVAPSGVGSAIDLNNLPSTLVDRVEIITGGASTVYGSDAIAGVVNFITRDDFEGLSFEGGYNISEQGDADIWDANLVYGLPLDNGGNLTFYAGHYERKELFAGERAFTRIVWHDDEFTGELYRYGSSAIPNGRVTRFNADRSRTEFTFDPDGTPRLWDNRNDRYNFAPVNYLQTPQSRDTAGVFGQVPMSGDRELYFEASYAQNDVTLALAPTPYFGTPLINLDSPILTQETRALFSEPAFAPFDPSVPEGIAQVRLTRRLLEMGPRYKEFERDYRRAVIGMRGEFADNWNFDSWITYTDAQEIETNINDALFSRIQQGLMVDPATGQCYDTSNGCVPVNFFGEGNLSDEAVAFIRAPNTVNETNRTQWLASAVVTGTPFEIWSGPVDMAFGLEWRRDEADFAADPFLFTGDTVGISGGPPINGTESVYELYSEAVATLVQSKTSDQKLDIEMGARWSSYKNAGTVDTWKTGLSWTINDAFRVRTMLQHAVRAPNNAELFTQQQTFVSNWTSANFADPCSASEDPVGRGNAEKCIAQGLPADQVGVFEYTPFYPTTFVGGGNPNLEPESSDTFTFGFVFSPMSVPDLTVAIDYYDLEVTDTIGDISVDVVCFDPVNTSGVFCDSIQRDTTGNVSYIESFIQNRGVLATEGIDVQVQYSLDLPEALSAFDDVASLSVNATLTHIVSLETQDNVASQVFDCNGLFGWPCDTVFDGASHPENRMLANINYAAGPFNAHLTWRWIEGMDSASFLGLPFFYGPNFVSGQSITDIPAWSSLDLGLSYRFGDNAKVRFGINNLEDKDPPFTADWTFSNNTDSLMYDVFGRTYYLNFQYQFTGN